MKKINKYIKLAVLPLMAGMFMITSCNKDLEQLPAIPVPVLTPYSPTISMGTALSALTNDSLFYRMVIKSGMLPTLQDTTKRLTLFAVDNPGMKIFVNGFTTQLVAQGVPGAVVIPLTATDATFSTFISSSPYISAGTAASIVQYCIVGQIVKTTSLPATFPNALYATEVQPSAASPFFRLATTVGKSNATGLFYRNNIPFQIGGQVDLETSNGLIQHTFTVVTPPSITLRSIYDAKTNLNYWKRALLRADSGQIVRPNNDSINFLNFFMGAPTLNMTVIAPSDAAFQTFIQTAVFGKSLQAGLTPANAALAAAAAVAAGPAFLDTTKSITSAQIRGLVAYHILASDVSGSFKPDVRAFSVNIPATATFAKTLVNGVVSAHPGVRAVATFAGPSTTSVTFTGFSALTGGAPFTDTPASVIDKDNNGVNGVLHIIDRVLVPQPL